MVGGFLYSFRLKNRIAEGFIYSIARQEQPLVGFGDSAILPSYTDFLLKHCQTQLAVKPLLAPNIAGCLALYDRGVDIYQILKLLPHRYPFLLIDKILEVDQKHFKALKNVTVNEPHFLGHFPSYPIMPGVLIVEAMAQASVAVVTQQPEYNSSGLVFLVGIDEARFKKPVVPGDTLILEGELLNYRRGLGKVRVQAKVEGELRAEALITFVLRSAEGGAVA